MPSIALFMKKFKRDDKRDLIYYKYIAMGQRKPSIGLCA